MKGDVIYYFIYDLGGEVELSRVGQVLDEHPIFEHIETLKTSPRYVDFPKPLTLRLPRERRDTTLGRLSFDVQVRVFAIGAASFQLRASFDVPSLADLTPYGDLRIVLPTGAEVPIESLTRDLFHRLQDGIGDAIVEEYALEAEPESYVVYAVRDLAPLDVGALIHKERRAIAGLLAGESRPERLSSDEVEDNLTHWFQYYEDDLTVVDWEAALVVESQGKWADVLYVIELANLQLLELRTYDRYLDTTLDKAYDDLSRFYGRRGLFQSARTIQEALSDARIDIIRVTDHINNIGKMYGDWFLAKLHVGVTRRFHLAEWEKIVNEKMTTLNELYALATHEVEHRRGLLLESLIVLLFVIDLLLLFIVSRG